MSDVVDWLAGYLGSLPIGETVEVDDAAYHAASYLHGLHVRVSVMEPASGSAVCYYVDLHDGTIVALFQRYYTARRVRIHE